MALTVARDISERKKAEQKMLQAYREIREIFDLAADGMCVINTEFEVVRANKTFAELCCMDSNKLIGQKCYNLLSGKSCKTESCAMKQIFQGKERIEAEVEKVNVKGKTLTCSVNVIPYKDSEGNIIGIIESIKDISEKKQAENIIRHMAYHDSLTDLPNRRFFNESLSTALFEAGSQGKKVGVIFLDLDKFKNVNDTLGHEIGDKLLQQVAYHLRSFMVDKTLVARMGGDEFILLIPDLDSESSIKELLTRIHIVFSKPWKIDNHRLDITASIGVSIFPSDGEDAVALLKNADIAMYQAKELGGNNYQRCKISPGK